MLATAGANNACRFGFEASSMSPEMAEQPPPPRASPMPCASAVSAASCLGRVEALSGSSMRGAKPLAPTAPAHGACPFAAACTLRSRIISIALGFGTLPNGPMAKTFCCISGGSARRQWAAPWSSRFSAMNLSSSDKAAPFGCKAAKPPAAAFGGAGCGGGWRRASRIRATNAPLGLLQFFRAPRSKTDNCMYGGSAMSSRAARASTRFSYAKFSISAASISLMMRISSGDLCASLPTPRQRPRLAAPTGLMLA
mmetsp:Transcript_118613/g.335514  ORF Transcript_118613/g.335514 Transcript_118613/m.335514 type:complete len:254 (-) Transcript_118613:51-812(-)